MLLLFALVTLQACQVAKVKVSDRTWYADAGNLGAAEFHTLSDKTRDISKPEWDKIRFGLFCTSSDTFTEMKINEETLCEETGRCDYEMRQIVNDFYERMMAHKRRIKNRSEAKNGGQINSTENAELPAL